MAIILVSACLLGVPCRYKGDSKPNERVLALCSRHTLVPICPEQLGGLPTPRESAEQLSGRVITKGGVDVTKEFSLGASNAALIKERTGAEIAILKARSPSCGSGEVYDGTFSGTLIPGDGITAALFKQMHMTVYTEENIPEDL